MIPPEIEQIFDVPTKKLFDEVKKDFNIVFKPWNKKFAGVYIENNSAIISINPKKVTVSCVAHELLHVWLKKLGYISPSHIRQELWEHSFLRSVFDRRLCDHISNCMGHLKMFPKYSEMGYSAESFILKGGKPQCSVINTRLIFLKINDNYSSKGVNRFIGHLIAILADHCDNNYSKQIRILKAKDEELFEIVSNFWNNWVVFDIENIVPDSSDGTELLNEFASQMKSWCDTKGINE